MGGPEKGALPDRCAAKTCGTPCEQHSSGRKIGKSNGRHFPIKPETGGLWCAGAIGSPRAARLPSGPILAKNDSFGPFWSILVPGAPLDRTGKWPKWGQTGDPTPTPKRGTSALGLPRLSPASPEIVHTDCFGGKFADPNSHTERFPPTLHHTALRIVLYTPCFWKFRIFCIFLNLLCQIQFWHFSPLQTGPKRHFGPEISIVSGAKKSSKKYSPK